MDIYSFVIIVMVFGIAAQAAVLYIADKQNKNNGGKVNPWQD